MATHKPGKASGLGDAGMSYDGKAREDQARKCASAVSAQKEMTPAGGYDSGYGNDRTDDSYSDRDPKGDLGGM